MAVRRLAAGNAVRFPVGDAVVTIVGDALGDTAAVLVVVIEIVGVAVCDLVGDTLVMTLPEWLCR